MKTNLSLLLFFYFIFLSCGSFKTKAEKRKVDFEGFHLETVFGETIPVKKVTGSKILIMNFWATWCKPCKSELPLLNDLYKEFKDKGVFVLSVNVNDPSELSAVKEWIKSNGLTFPVINDTDGSIVQELNPRLTLPFTIVFEKSYITKTYKGFNYTDFENLKKKINEILKKDNN